MTLNEICQMTENPELLNALHACREGHPMNGAFQWRNAHSLAIQSRDTTLSAVFWLKTRADKEAHDAVSAAEG